MRIQLKHTDGRLLLETSEVASAITFESTAKLHDSNIIAVRIAFKQGDRVEVELEESEYLKLSNALLVVQNPLLKDRPGFIDREQVLQECKNFENNSLQGDENTLRDVYFRSALNMWRIFCVTEQTSPEPMQPKDDLAKRQIAHELLLSLMAEDFTQNYRLSEGYDAALGKRAEMVLKLIPHPLALPFSQLLRQLQSIREMMANERAHETLWEITGNCFLNQKDAEATVLNMLTFINIILEVLEGFIQPNESALYYTPKNADGKALPLVVDREAIAKYVMSLKVMSSTT